MTATTRYPTLAGLTAAAVVAGLALTGCGSKTPAAASGVDRTDPRAVADAFANAWAGGDLATACSYTTQTEHDHLNSQSLCSGTAGWPHQTPRAKQTCTFPGGYEVVYVVDQPVNRFLIFKPNLLQDGDGTWAVDNLGQNSPGESGASCESSQTSAGTS